MGQSAIFPSLSLTPTPILTQTPTLAPAPTRARTLTFPQPRYVGHSWASGIFPSGSGRNQESVSEALNAWYGLSLYGLALGDAGLRDLGRLMLATELRSGSQPAREPASPGPRVTPMLTSPAPLLAHV